MTSRHAPSSKHLQSGFVMMTNVTRSRLHLSTNVVLFERGRCIDPDNVTDMLHGEFTAEAYLQLLSLNVLLHAKHD